MTYDSRNNDDLTSFRSEINRLDEELIKILSKRLEVCSRVASYKSKHGIAMMQPDRVEEVKNRCAQMAAINGLDRDFTRDIYGRIIDEACKLETRIMEL